MAKTTATVTTSWQQVATGPVVVTVKTQGDGVLLFDENQNDATAYRSSAPVGEQFQQNEILPTYARATGEGWVITIDGML